MKKGSQHTTKAPVMMAKVFAAFFSLLASRSLILSFLGWPDLGAGVVCTSDAAELFTLRFTDLEGSVGCGADPLLVVAVTSEVDFSGERLVGVVAAWFADIVNAVVASPSTLLGRLDTLSSSTASTVEQVDCASTRTREAARFSEAVLLSLAFILRNLFFDKNPNLAVFFSSVPVDLLDSKTAFLCCLLLLILFLAV